MSTDASSVWTLCLLKIDIRMSLASLHRYYSPEWSVLMDKTTWQTAQILTNVPRHIMKFARHLSSSNVSWKTRSHQPLLCGWWQTSHCTVEPTMTTTRLAPQLQRAAWWQRPERPERPQVCVKLKLSRAELNFMHFSSSNAETTANCKSGWDCFCHSKKCSLPS